MAFDFFNISGSLFVETNTNSKIRSSAQGLFMMMTNGFGAVLGSLASGWAIDKYFTKSFSNSNDLASYLDTESTNGLLNKFIESQNVLVGVDGTFNNLIYMKDWHQIWLAFAMYSLIVAVLFAIFFKHKHDPKEVENISH